MWRRTDALGAVLAVLLIGWILVASSAAGGSPRGMTLLVVGAAATFVAGRVFGLRWPRAAVLIVILVATALGAWAAEDILRDRPLGRPFGYDNATAAFFVEAAAAGWMLTLRARRTLAIAPIAILTGAFALVPFLVGSLAAEILVVAVLGIGAIGWFGRPRTGLVVGLVAIAFAAVLSATIALGATYQPAGIQPSGQLIDALSERRLALWHDGLQLIHRHPLFGVGISRFDDVSEVARADPDTRLAHNEYLQVAAEAGVVGGVLLAALSAWAILRTGSEASGKRRTWALIASAACGALAIHASVDYVMHTAAVPLTAAYLSGIASAGGREADGTDR